MNILNNLTIRNLKLNKKRTIVTIIGIILSTALICAVAGMFSSLQATLIASAKENNGNQHITVEGIKSDDLKYFENNRHVESMYIIENLGYAPLTGSKNPYKPYMYVIAYTKEAFDNTKITLVDGRLPQNASEIIISKSIIDNAEVNIKIGDRISLDIGSRICSDGSIMTQNNPYFVYEEGYNEIDECNETLNYEYTKEYTVVGIMERLDYNIESYNAPGYTVITYTDNLSSNSYNVSLLFKDPGYYKDFINTLANSDDLKDYNYTLNADLLRWEGVGLSGSNQTMLYTVAGVVIAIIIITSVFVIRNSFNISITEKTKQYGMLASIGATSKQIKKNVLYEGFILGLIGIPIGILCGILAVFILCNVVNFLMPEFIRDTTFVFNVPILPILLSIALAVITIYLSVISAARKSSKISPIEAIRNNNEIKINPKKLKTPKIIGKLFGVGGEIAYKNLKRSRKKYRTTVISLVVSVAVFISLSSLLNYGFNLTGMYYKDLAFNMEVSIYPKTTDTETTNDDIASTYNEILDLANIEDYSLQRRIQLNIDGKTYMTDMGFSDYFGGNKTSYTDDDTVYVELVSLGDAEYERFLERIGGNKEDYQNGGILIDDGSTYIDEHYEHFNIYNVDPGDTITGTLENGTEYSLNIVARADERPMGLENLYSSSGYIIVSDSMMDNLDYSYSSLFINSSDTTKLENEITDYLENIDYEYYLYNVEEEVNAQKSMILLISIFLYGFIIVISLIGITNIFNTITTNMNLRSREFAMLKSIGMTKREFNRMVHLESIFYGTKSLLIGIPLGLLGSFGIYKAFAVGNDFGFIIPCLAILIAVVVVFLLISIIMHVSVKKINKQNIIETIRNENI